MAVALGVFIGASPFWGFHTVLAVGLAILFGLNKPAVVFGTFVSNPWFAPFVIFLSLEAGSWLLYGRTADLSIEQIRAMLHEPNWQKILYEFLLPYCAGSFAVGLVFAVAAFWITLWVARSYQEENGTHVPGGSEGR